MKAMELADADYDELVLKSDLPVLIDFGSPTCGPCRALAPVLDQLADEYADKVKIFKVNVFENVAVAGKLAVEALPTLVMMKSGTETGRLTGPQNKEKVKALIESQL
ncbi:MAG: thiol reductase thioredoxin [Thermoguttaceae bacterium]|nr:thiol reductase thioredoxin [Thermoguttaceae bacterium]MBQ6619443.1 thiol reductase thioredoxin [Thermoguttaceae bacterium]